MGGSGLSARHARAGLEAARRARLKSSPFVYRYIRKRNAVTHSQYSGRVEHARRSLAGAGDALRGARCRLARSTTGRHRGEIAYWLILCPDAKLRLV